MSAAPDNTVPRPASDAADAAGTGASDTTAKTILSHLRDAAS